MARSGREQTSCCERQRRVDVTLRPAGAARRADGEQTTHRFIHPSFQQQDFGKHSLYFGTNSIQTWCLVDIFTKKSILH